MSPLTLNRRAAGQAGFILPTAIIVLFMFALLTGVAIAVAVQTSSSTTRDNNSKAALQASEAALRVAAFRLNALKPKEANCITGTEEKAPTGGSCEDASAENLGNGATFRYWTTAALSAGEKCGGSEIKAEAGVIQRCITGEGTVNGVVVRTQVLVTATAGKPLFSVHGILGLTEVTVSGSVKVPGLVASNGKITVSGGGSLSGGWEVGPAGTFSYSGGGACCGSPEKKRTAEEGAFAPATGNGLPAGHATAASNEDSRIGAADEFFTEGKAVNKFTGSPTYELNLGSNSKLTLGGSKYYLCNFHASNNSRLKIAAGAKVEIFIDSPEHEEGGKKCPAGTGKFEGEGEFAVENVSKNPAALLIEMYGKGPIAFKNGTTLEASIYAPEAEVALNGATKFKGGIVANKVPLTAGAGVFEWSEELSFLGTSPGSFGRKGSWEQCGPGSGAKTGC